jgi:hypothetical protein
MESLGIAAANPDKVPHYIIAECADSDDMLTAFALLKVMEGVKDVLHADARKKVEIISLSEYPDRIREEDGVVPMVEMLKAALRNPHFRGHHAALSADSPLLNDYHLGDNAGRTLTVADAKSLYGIPVNDGDETRALESAKIMMVAGSDMTKVGSIAANAAAQHAVHRAREALIEDGILPVFYTGVGGAVSRSSPAFSDANMRTVQGSAVRGVVEVQARAAVNWLGLHVWRRLAWDPQHPGGQENKFLTRKAGVSMAALCQLNLGNSYGVPARYQDWHGAKTQSAPARDRTYAMIAAYETLYQSEDFAALMRYSAFPFITLTSFSARPVARVEGNAAAETFPLPVNVKKMRAIGFGGALNVAGICAPLYCGGSAYLEGGMMRKIYQHDPRVQDTINRMTYGVVMADMRVAWKYLGFDTPPDSKTLDVWKNNPPDMEDERAAAVRCLARINVEYNAVANQLLRLHCQVNNTVPPNDGGDMNGGDAARQLLNILPAPWRWQLQRSREDIAGPRSKLATIFNEVSEGRRSFDSLARGTADYERYIYPLTAAAADVFERPQADSVPAKTPKAEAMAKAGAKTAAKAGGCTDRIYNATKSKCPSKKT